jgi:hypothetical protein
VCSVEATLLTDRVAKRVLVRLFLREVIGFLGE